MVKKIFVGFVDIWSSFEASAGLLRLNIMHPALLPTIQSQGQGAVKQAKPIIC